MENRAKKGIWVYVDLRDERLFGYSLNVMARARELTYSISGKIVAILIDSPDDNSKSAGEKRGIPSGEAAERCLSHGADAVHIFENPDFAVPRPDIYAPVISDAVRHHEPMLVLFPMTEFGKELAARSARICTAGLIADCTALTMKDDRIVASCPSWGGEILAEITFDEAFHTTGFATVNHHGITPIDTAGDPGAVEKIPVEKVVIPRGIKFLSSTYESEGRKKLEEAEIVVVGGAGLGTADGFGLARDLASALGGEIGATRPPVLMHWTAEDNLIGQTGKTVKPELLLSCGTSGAIQYTAGITDSKTIVAINRDPNAPIFQVADLGITADAATFLPALTAKVKQTVMRSLTDSMHEGKGETGTVSGFGEKLLRLRESHGWSRESLAQSTGQSPEFIEQCEKNEISPSVSFLLRLSRILDVDPGTFLHESEKTAIRDQRAKQFMQRTQNYSYQTLTPGAENEHLRSFMITIEPRQAHKPVAYKHEGEEFIYVMEGDLELTLGGKAHKLRPHESIRFNSEIPHKLKSLSNEPTRCLVVLYTP
ncbi:MAG TPA: FAD-binding protein [Syntrophales bacterium]|nr:FAD-binding protein [Syntrophales bacterium]HPQ42602.1 FAD-binding protein [Syntrophales bacterium]